jgi:hypothetical protein
VFIHDDGSPKEAEQCGPIRWYPESFRRNLDGRTLPEVAAKRARWRFQPLRKELNAAKTDQEAEPFHETKSWSRKVSFPFLQLSEQQKTSSRCYSFS